METNSEQIKDLLKQNESELLEFKEKIHKDNIGSIICSFLNNKGGQVLIGISDKKEIVGVKNAEQAQKELEKFLIKELVPEAPVMVSLEKFEGKELILLKVWAGSNQPYIFNGSIFYRRGEKTVQASSKEISELIHNRQISEVHWERRAVLGIELEDLDLEEIKKTIEIAIDSNKMKEEKKTPLDFLSYYGLFKNGNFTNAAVILFAKEPARFLPQSRVRIALLSEEGKTGDKFFDDQILEGNLFKDFDNILNFFKKHLNHISMFNKESWQRKDDLTYPLMALREGVLNALIHRDYSNISGTVSIIIYPDRLEITNNGHLQLKLSELKKEHQSILINPDIAHIAFLRGYIDKIGRGTLKIIEACKDSGLKAPEWTTDSNSVKLSFFSNVQPKEANIKTNEGLIEGITEGLIEGITEGLREKLNALIMVIAKDEGKRIPYYAEKISESDKNIERYIKQLKEEDIIEYKGSKKSGGYYLTKNFQNKLKPQ